MELLFTKTKQLITPQILEEVSNLLMIDEAASKSTTDTIITGLFCFFLRQGDTPEAKKLLNDFISNVNDDRDIDIYSFENHLNEERTKATIELSDSLFLNKRKEFISLVSETASVNEELIETLVTTLTYTVALDFGRKVETKEYTITGLLAQIYAEREFFFDKISPQLLSLLDTTSLLTIGHNLSSDARVASHMVYVEIQHMRDTEAKEVEGEEKNNWWKWFSSKAAL